MRKAVIVVISAVFAFSSCCDKGKNVEENVIVKKDTCNVSGSEYQTGATLWFQKSAEAKAIYYQTFNLAKKVLDEKLKKEKFKLRKKKPKAIIADVDETVLNNSPYNARLISEGKHFEKESWSKWVNEKTAKALPGSVEFMNYAKEKGVEVFYVSNRSVENIEPTLENLKNEKFPFADKNHLLFKDQTSDKTERRDSVLKNYDVIMFLGDNLRDFDEIFKYKNNAARNDSVVKYKDLFGTEFIIFPNPMYGEWEKTIYKGDFSKSDTEKYKMRIDALDKI